MGERDGLLAFTGKGFKNRAVARLGIFAFKSSLDGIFAEAAHSVLLEIRRRLPVLFVLVTADAALIRLAFASRAHKEMIEPVILITTDLDLVLEKGICN